MQVILLLIVCLAFLPEHPSASGLDPTWVVVWTALGVGLLFAASELLATYFAWQLYHDPGRRYHLLRWYARFRFLHFALTIAVYVLTVFQVGWGWVVREHWRLQNVVLLDELLILAPFLAALVLGWFSFYRVERALHDTSSAHAAAPFWGRAAYVWFHVRHQLGLVLAPIVLFTGFHELADNVFGLANRPWFQLASLAFLALMILVLMPWLLTVLWGAKALPAGPLRDRLEAAARRLRFRCTDVLLWNTRGGMANAMVTGVFPFPRYVLLSDSLVDGLKPEEVEAVFGHEIGHVRHHHMLLYLAFLFLSVTLLLALGRAILPPLELTWSALLGSWTATSGQLGACIGALAFVGGYIWLVFGLLSRRCEWQADVYGCKAVSCRRPTCAGHESAAVPASAGDGLCPTGIRTFIAALEKVADLNGIRRDKPSWRHSSIARRVAFLERLLADPASERRFQRRLFAVKCALFLSLLGLLAALWACGVPPAASSL
jgi:STE24 endopeptidase